MKKVTIHSKSYLGKANSVIAEELGLGLSKLGFQVNVVSISPSLSDSVTSSNLSQNFTRILLPHYQKDLTILNFLRRGLVSLEEYKEIDTDIIILFDPIIPETFLPLLVGRARKIPTAVYLADNWGMDPDRSRNWVEEVIEEIMIFASFKLSKLQLYLSEFVRNRMQKYTRSHGIVIRSGFNSEEFLRTDPRFDKGWIHNFFNLPTENKVILTSYDARAKETYVKLAHQFESLRMKFTVVLLNANDYLSRSTEISDLVEKRYLIISDRLERDEYIHAITNADILWISGSDTFWDRSRFPTRLPEYMATGNPIVSSIRGTSKIFLCRSGYESISEYAFPKSDFNSIVQSFEFMVSGKTDVRAATKLALAYAYEHLTWVEISKDVAKIIESALK